MEYGCKTVGDSLRFPANGGCVRCGLYGPHPTPLHCIAELKRQIELHRGVIATLEMEVEALHARGSAGTVRKVRNLERLVESLRKQLAYKAEPNGATSCGSDGDSAECVIEREAKLREAYP